MEDELYDSINSYLLDSKFPVGVIKSNWKKKMKCFVLGESTTFGCLYYRGLGFSLNP